MSYFIAQPPFWKSAIYLGPKKEMDWNGISKKTE
jgi:hypothetical protein